MPSAELAEYFTAERQGGFLLVALGMAGFGFGACLGSLAAFSSRWLGRWSFSDCFRSRLGSLSHCLSRGIITPNPAVQPNDFAVAPLLLRRALCFTAHLQRLYQHEEG